MRDKYLCVKCGTVAQEVHHIEHLNPSNINDPNITINQNNLMSLCKQCHFNEHKGEHGKGLQKNEGIEMIDYTFDEYGNVIQRM